MKYILLSIAAIISTFSIGQAPVFDWVRQIKGSEYEKIEDIVVDDDGYVYTTGYFKGTADFNPAATPDVYTTSQFHDMFIQKIAPTGEIVWLKRIGGSSALRAYSIDVNDQAVVVTGDYSGTVDFDPGTGVAEEGGFSNSFVLKLDTDGNFQWVKVIEDGSCRGTNIGMDDNGNVYYGGTFVGAIDFDPGTGVSNLTTVGNSNDVFFSKLTASGDFVWVKSIGGTGGINMYSFDVNGAGDCAAIGGFTNTIDFDLDATTNHLISQFNVDGWLLCLDLDGNENWVRQFKGQGSIYGKGVTVDESGNVDFSVSYSNAMTVEDGNGTQQYIVGVTSSLWACLGQFNGSTGVLNWVKTIDGSMVFAEEVDSDISGSMVFTGMMQGSTQLAEDAIITDVLETDSSFVMYTTCLDVNGNLLWHKSVESGISNQSHHVAFGDDNAVYTSGIFYDTLDFHPGTSGANLTTYDNTDSDAFLMKLKHPLASVNTQESKSILIYPNPTNDLLFVKGLDKSEKVRVLNSLGQTVFTGKMNNSIDVSSLKTGVYFLKLFDGDKQRVLRFIKK
ncbi:MAG: T9SS type A sorting domain-containing protein [Crocinitomicaceae bacterium]|nr:T9SS type A sorting domain-containing protein [Flavobacteriales bacterium]NQZ38138.1 T9SS type A sorting domain-containing protein [Crocinitomicaceae bacterium]